MAPKIWTGGRFVFRADRILIQLYHRWHDRPWQGWGLQRWVGVGVLLGIGPQGIAAAHADRHWAQGGGGGGHGHRHPQLQGRGIGGITTYGKFPDQQLITLTAGKRLTGVGVGEGVEPCRVWPGKVEGLGA